jgi:hypothetical protein
MSYGMGEDVPLILAGAARRETLSPEQLARLESQGIPTTGANSGATNVKLKGSSALLPLLLGGVAAFFLTGHKGSRKLWLHPVALIWALLLVPLSAQWVITTNGTPWTFHGATASTVGIDGAWAADTNTGENLFLADNLTSDSLRFVVAWKQPTDGMGNADSTVFRIVITKDSRWYAKDSVVITASTNQRRRYTTQLADSLKMAKPAMGDSVSVTISGFIQCRKGDCSNPGGAAAGYRTTWAPVPSGPSLRSTVF